MHPIPAIITNAKNRIAYNVTRSLGQKGVPVYTADFIPRAMASASVFSHGSFLYPSPFKDQEEFIKCLRDKILSLGECVLMPVFEETFLLAKYREELPLNTRMVIPQYEQILTAHNKDRWQTIAGRLGIPVPNQCSIESIQQGKVKTTELRYPVLIKPKQGGGAWAITQVDTPRCLDAFVSQDSNNGLPWERFFCQEKIIGETHCVAMLFRNGEIRAKVAYKQLRDYPVSGGQATLRVSIKSSLAEAYLLKLLESLEWHGVCQADFIVNTANMTPYLIDINPRFWGSLVQAIAAGVDFPYLMYKIAVHGDVEPITSFKTGVITRWIGGDLRTFVPLLKCSQDKMNFIRQFFFPKEKAKFFDDFHLDDPMPFVYWAMDALRKIARNRTLKPISHDSLEGIWE